MILAATEFDRMTAQLQALAPRDWAQPTVCELWDVRAMAAHVLGMAEAQASFRQFAHDFRAAGKRSGGKMIDEMSATQVRERAAMTPGAIVTRLAAVAPRAVRARRRTPALVRWAVRLKNDPPFDAERWRYGYLVDTIFTRDTWMHRLDISRATGRPMELTAGHDGRLVADVVTEWARRHGQPFTPHPDRHGRRPVALRGGGGASPARCARLLLDRRRPSSPAPGSWPRRSRSEPTVRVTARSSRCG